MKRTHVDLFSGIGGFSLACEWAGVETIAFAEIDDYASRVLQRHWPTVRNYGDVRGLPHLSAWLLTAGVPCQPASVAGNRRGAEDDRWLWPQTLTVVGQGAYEWLLFENPGGILALNGGLEFERICVALECLNYSIQPFAVPACAVGANHRRQRIWILAHANSNGVERRSNGSAASGNGPRWQGSQAHLFAQKEFAAGFESGRESELIRADARLSNWTHRVRCIGNSICPQVAYQLIKRMIEAEEKH